MTLGDLRVLLDYHYWARDRMLDAVSLLAADEFTRDMGNSFRSVRDTAVHTYSAEWVWYSRWQGSSPTAPIPFEQFPDASSLRAAWSTLEAQLRAHLDQLGESGITREIDYTLMNGQPGRAVFWHMLQHVINHATYHRGQVTTLLRQLGAAPPKSQDLIAFHRERAEAHLSHDPARSGPTRVK